MLARNARAFCALAASAFASCSLPWAMPFCCSASRYFRVLTVVPPARASTTATAAPATTKRLQPPSPAEHAALGLPFRLEESVPIELRIFLHGAAGLPQW